MNKTTALVVISLLALTAAALTYTSLPLPLAQGQLPQEVPPPTDVWIWDADSKTTSMALNTAIPLLWNLTNAEPLVTFTEDGTMSITHTINTERGLVSISVRALHNLTPENGFVYDGDANTITAPNGTVIVPQPQEQESE